MQKLLRFDYDGKPRVAYFHDYEDATNLSQLAWDFTSRGWRRFHPHDMENVTEAAGSVVPMDKLPKLITRDQIIEAIKAEDKDRVIEYNEFIGNNLVVVFEQPKPKSPVMERTPSSRGLQFTSPHDGETIVLRRNTNDVATVLEGYGLRIDNPTLDQVIEHLTKFREGLSG